VHDIKNNIVDRLKRDKTPCTYSYELHFESIQGSPFRSKKKWAQELGEQIDAWMYVQVWHKRNRTMHVLYRN